MKERAEQIQNAEKQLAESTMKWSMLDLEKAGLTRSIWQRIEKELSEEEKKNNRMAANAGKSVLVLNTTDLNAIDELVGVINVDKNTCNSQTLKELDMTRMKNLRVLTVGKNCFKYVARLKIDKLDYLESITIGENSFREENMIKNQPSNRVFSLFNCKQLKTLKIGIYSFSDYSRLEIDHVPSLTSIEIGDLNEQGYNFHNADLILKSRCQGME